MSTPTSVIHLYMSSPSAGAANGTLVSESGGNAVVVTGYPNSTSVPVKLAARATAGDCFNLRLSFTGTNAGLCSFSVDLQNWVNVLVIDTVTAVNSVFYVRSTVGRYEAVGDDTSVSITFTYLAPV